MINTNQSAILNDILDFRLPILDWEKQTETEIVTEKLLDREKPASEAIGLRKMKAVFNRKSKIQNLK